MIIVTRPSPEGEDLTKQLNQAHFPAMHLPLFNIIAGNDLVNLQQQLDQLLPLDMVIISSPQVAYIIKKTLANLSFPKHVRYFAIGEKSANLFGQLINLTIHYPEQENSEGLLQLLARESLKNRNILILRGNTGRQLLTENLTLQQAKVKLIECYRRQPIKYPNNILADHIAEQIIIVTSVEHLLQLEAYCHNTHKHQVNLIVTSERIFNQAKQLKWQKVLQVASAHNQDLLTAIERLYPNHITNKVSKNTS
ncbi:hypothetical protein A9G13_02830 [Gilliamella sp. wkB178]|uniref:uroporphyrinogen-III synthase n=1 Tax=Gilliamella sp. wkB178 TaxID=3120259 RepID=UPI00080E76B8|nr:uroporphyrinogen-III synthase [Gilliamella apicola]OCG09009.1 hypothetical protein A9G13_02830 [Gilliamella apicola]